MAHMCSFISCNYVPFCIFVFVQATIGCIGLLCIVLCSLHFVIFFAFLFFCFLLISAIVLCFCLRRSPDHGTVEVVVVVVVVVTIFNFNFFFEIEQIL